MPKAKRLPSGSWRVQVYAGKALDGKPIRESFTAPTKKEAEYMAAQWQLQRSARPEDYTVAEAISAYIDAKSAILSPSTVQKYKSLARRPSPASTACSLPPWPSTPRIRRTTSTFPAASPMRSPFPPRRTSPA